MSWSDVQWGTVGEWVSGTGALAAVGAAFYLQRRSHVREDARLAVLEGSERRRAQSEFARQVRGHIVFKGEGSINGVDRVVKVTCVNGSEHAIYNVHIVPWYGYLTLEMIHVPILSSTDRADLEQVVYAPLHEGRLCLFVVFEDDLGYAYRFIEDNYQWSYTDIEPAESLRTAIRHFEDAMESASGKRPSLTVHQRRNE